MKNKKWIIVSGASGGIGKSVVKELLNENYGVIALYLNTDNFEEFTQNSFIKYKLDITNEDEVKELFVGLNDKIGKIYGFVHCAGTQVMKSVSSIKKNNLGNMFDVNVFSAFTFIKFLSKKKYGEKNGSIVLISSLAAHEGAIGNAFYASTKGALEGYLKSASSELLNNKRINIVTPGVLELGMGEKYQSKLSDEQQKELKKEYPLGLGKGKDLGYMIEFLLSEKSQWITGQNFILDGGHMSVSR